MDKIVVKNSRGKKLWAKFALVILCALLVSAFIYESAFALNLPILHNSSTNSNKYGSWGLDKGCSWCHSKGSVNVKLIAENIVTPSGSRKVVFYRMTAVSNDADGVLGNDARTYGGNGDGSANICEVCHRQTYFHTYSATGSGHYDNRLCVSCHSHADGFKPQSHEVPYSATSGVGHPGCSTATGCHVNINPVAPYPTAGTAPDCRSCHGKADPTASNGCGSCHGAANGNGEPTDTIHPDAAGSHAAHTIIGGVTCASCHDSGGSEGNAADHGRGNRGANPAVVNLKASFEWNGANSTCASTSCHVSVYDQAAVTSPAWGTTAGCAACHNGTPGAFQANGAPATGSHNVHLIQPGSSCGQCHDGTVSGASGGNNHDNGTINVTNGYPVTAKHAPGTYAGSCSTASCHSDPYSASTITSPVWGAISGCASCHTGAGVFTADGAPATGSHAVHMALINSACNQCHENAVKGVSGGSSHPNGSVDVSNDYVGSPLARHPAGTYTGYCMSASCHASPYGTGAVSSPVWGATSGCVSCHTDTGAFVANGAPATGSHAKHMALNNANCSQCHAGAVSGTNPGNHHSDGFVNVTGGYTATPARHPIGTYAGTCANSCHTNGNGTQLSSPKWGVAMPVNCTGCHGGAADVTPISSVLSTGKHRSHMNNYSTLGLGNNLKCGECHAKTVSLASNTAITVTGNHINSYKDYSGVKAGGGTNYITASGVCSNVYCHSNGQQVPRYVNMTGSKAWSGNAKFDCSGCHGSEPGAIWNSSFGAPNYQNKYDGTLKTANSHERHTLIAGTTDSRGCAKCHATSVDQSVASKLRNYSATHLNGARDISFAIYGIYSANTRSCSTYCHSNVQAPGGNGSATIYAKPVWGDNNSMTCASCHKDMAILQENAEDLAFGSHKRHTVDAVYSCALCHGSAYSASSAETVTHSNGSIDIAFTGGKAQGTTYSQQANNLPGDNYGTCSTSKCHGRATKNWGISTTLTRCEKCHGSSRTAIVDGVFKDTAGSPTGSYVGTHVSHLAGTHNLTAPLQCSECHTIPSSITSFGHMSSLPARIAFGVLSVRSSVVRAGDRNAMTPSYNTMTRRCSNTYCHGGVQIKDVNTGVVTYQGAKPEPSWGESAFACNMCHGYPPKGLHTTSVNCSACHNHVDFSNQSLRDKTKHINGIVETTVDDCLGCHSSYNTCSESDPSCINKELVGGHLTHTNSEMFLAGKKLSTGDYIDPSWIYGITFKKGFPQYACGFCHPMDMASHKNGLIEIDMDPSHALRGSVKTKNKAGGPWLVTYVPNDSVICNNVYCHSSGYVSDVTRQYQFKQTPDWYYADKHGGTSFWAAVDRCAECHGNSPNTGGTEGSKAHARHVVANHYKDVFDNYSAKLLPAGAPGSGAVHGDPATATNFNCNICHFETVRDNFNDKGSVCIDCHSTTGKGIMGVFSASTKHVNGDIDVVFMEPFNFKSKAQLRDSIYSVQSVYTSWTRVKGYKTYSSYDLARRKPQYVGGTCTTTSCHNGTQMEWRTKGPLSCAACHTGLPQ